MDKFTVYMSGEGSNWRLWTLCSNVVRPAAATVLSRWRRAAGYPCSRKTAQLSCIIGCYGCATTYGRYVYDMAACCRECQLTQADIVDVGPEQCSAEFIIAPGERKVLRSRNWWRLLSIEEEKLWMSSSTFCLLTDVATLCDRRLYATVVRCSLPVPTDARRHFISIKCFRMHISPNEHEHVLW